MSRPAFRRPNYDDDEQEVESVLAKEQRPGTSEESTSIIYHNSHLALSIQQQRSRLPIAKLKNQLLYLVERFRCVVVVGETGSGKSTQVPQFLAEAGWADNGLQIAITEPRRLATRVASEVGCSLGERVGFVLRFNEVMSEKTQIKFMTDGILLRELHGDPLLTKYSVVIVDEAHERSITTDLILGLLKRVLSVRLDLRVIVMSATVDAELFKEFFEFNDTADESKDTSVIVSVEGRMFPVSVFYTKVPVPDYVKATTEAIINIHKTEKHGDILAFLTGQDEVEQVCGELRELSRHLKGYDRLRILPLYSGLSQQQQIGVFDSAAYGTRKVIVSTNLAETSVTIPGIVYVVDSGFVKLRVNNVHSNIETLMTLKISKSSAKQRAGRAGRVLAGKCFRLYPESEYAKLPPSQIPEIQRVNLASAILQLKALGIQNLLKFSYISRPPSQLVIQGLHLLYALEAIDDNGLMTNPVGTTMSSLALNPMHAKVLLSSAKYECSEEIAAILAMLQIQNVFNPLDNRHMAEVTKRKFAVEEGDHLTLLNVYLKFVENGVYLTLRDSTSFNMFKGSALMYCKEYPKLVVFTDVLQNSIRDCSVIEMEWLQEIAGHYYDFGLVKAILIEGIATEFRNLKAAISRLKRTGEGDDLEELQQSVDALIDLVCDLDLALDFCKLEGLKIVEELLNKFSDSINQRVIPIISEISQNNPSVQQQVLKTKLLESLLLLLDESSETTSAVRFIKLGGLETVMQTFDSAIKNGDARLVLRCVVMVVNSKRSAAPELLKRLSINPEVYYERMRSALKDSGESDKYNEALEYLESDPV
ncbi:hypothetical protein M3Y98_00343500 [Aphelenchoides besseyi]|nr:hypothetical protein M3Y98_00343500 [Aphelenchoides besseyi]KAI6194384.1 hypothetical protein M3Y96_01119000 [Aphelenchoides besseyi]